MRCGLGSASTLPRRLCRGDACPPLGFHCRGASFSRTFSDPYTVLGVSRDATIDDIKAAYHKAALRTHPDSGGSAEEFRRVQTAYKKLSDPSQAAINPRHHTDETPHPNWPRREAAPEGMPQFRTVAVQAAEELFKEAFDGRGVEQVLDAEMHEAGWGTGVHAKPIREALFAKLLREARAAHAHNEAKKREAAATASTSPDVRPDRVEVSRQKVTDLRGVTHVRITKTTFWPDGREDVHVTEKPVYRLYPEQAS